MMALQGLTFGYMNYIGYEMPKVERKKAANPLWNHYLCADDKWLVLGMLQADQYWPTICRALGIEHLEKDPRFDGMAKRTENSNALIAIMDGRFITKSSKEWMKILKKTGDVICTPVQSAPDLLNDPQVWANDYFIEYEHETLGKITGMGLPYHLSKTPGKVKLEAPEFGQHTEEVLLDIGGYTWEEIVALKDKGVI
jgi:crotonobetainyl-CoA:carnitine CoA-transferase CaiB-like acyl-CoA transferase